MPDIPTRKVVPVVAPTDCYTCAGPLGLHAPQYRATGEHMNVSLRPQYEEMVRRKVESGHYRDECEVLEEALQLLDERDRLAELRALIAHADEQINRGEVMEWTPDTMAEIIREADEEDRLGLPIDDHVRP